MSRRRARYLKRIRHLMAMQNGECLLCGRPMSRSNVSIEHVVPRSQSGTDVAASHITCNHKRGSTPLTEEQWARYRRWYQPTATTSMTEATS